MDEQSRTRDAMTKLTDVLAGIARTADQKNLDRCPYKTVDLRCTYHGGCRNQIEHTSHLALRSWHCSGDNLNFSPSDRRPETSDL